MSPLYEIYEGDSLVILPTFQPESADLIFADPPYFLSNDGITCQGGKMVSVNKGEWDKSQGTENDEKFTRTWLEHCYNLLSPNGSIWVSGTQHSIFAVGHIMQQIGYYIINDIIWFKPNAPPNLACTCFTHSHETLLWATKSKEAQYTFNYDLTKRFNHGKQLRSVWIIPKTPASEKVYGEHPTQKPLELLERIILLCSNELDKIYDPFSGTATTGVAAIKYGRRYRGIEINQTYNNIAKLRLEHVVKSATKSVKNWV